MSACWKAWSANHNATSECLPPWPRSVVRSADLLPARAGRKQQRLRKRCGPKQSAASGYWLAFVVAMVVMGKYPPTRRIRTNNDLPARAALCAPQPAAAFLGGRRLARNPFFVAGLELKRELVAGDLRDPVDDLIAIVIIAVVYTTAPGCLIERRTIDRGVDHGQEDRRRHQRVPLLLGAGFTAAGGALMAGFGTDNTATSGLRHLSIQTEALVAAVDDINGTGGFGTGCQQANVADHGGQPEPGRFCQVSVPGWLSTDIWPDSPSKHPGLQPGTVPPKNRGALRPHSGAAPPNQSFWIAHGSGRQEPARSEGRSGGHQRFRAGSSGRSPSLTSAWVPVRRCRS